MASAAQAYKHYKNTLGETDSATIAAKANMDAYKSEYRAAVQKVKKLEGQNVALKKSTQNAFSAAQTRLCLREIRDIMTLSQQRGCRHGEITASA